MASAPIWLFDLDGYTDVAASQTYRLSTRPYWTLRTDTPANVGYDDRVENPGYIRRRLFSDGASGIRANPRAELVVGEVIVGALDGLIDSTYGTSAISFRERPLVIRKVEEGAAFSTAIVVLRGLVAKFRKSRETFAFGIRDRGYELDSPHLTATFAGTNALPNGLEGGAEMAGKNKPRIRGKVFLVEPPCCNTARLIYYLTDRALQSIAGLYDGAVAITAGVSRTLAEMAAGTTSATFTADVGTNVLTTGAAHGLATAEPVTFTSSGTLPAPLVSTAYYYARVLSATTLTLHPSAADASANTNVVDITTTGSGTHTQWRNATLAGHYDWCFDSSGSYARLGTKPVYRITFDAVADTAADSTVAQLLKSLALDRGVASGDISAADVSALDALTTAVCGIYITTETTLEAMDQVAASAGVSYDYDPLGVLRMRRFDVPSGSAVAIVGQTEYATLDQLDTDEDVPTLDVRLEYARYYTVQGGGELSSAATAAQQADLAQEFRVSQHTGTISPNPHKRTLTATRRTLLTAKADADAEALRLYNITSTPRRTFQAKGVLLDDATLAAIDLNAVVEVRGDRYGLDPVNGTLMRVTEIVYYLQDRKCDLKLWC